jgi:tight adherence protein C
MSLVISVTLFCLLVAAITVYGYRHYSKPAQLYEQLAGGSSMAAGPQFRPMQGPQSANPIITVIRHVGEKVPISPESATLTRRYLIAAGYRADGALKVFYGIKVVFAVALAVAFWTIHQYFGSGVNMSIFVTAIGAGAGYFAPNLMLDRLISKRQEDLRLSLPDALDLMVICLEVGLALDQAILHVARDLQITHKALADELTLVNLEMRAGKRRSEALRNLADRTGEEELRRLTAVLIQTDRFGTSVSESLRTHSDFMRIRRRQLAEERANKVGVKLVFPIFFFILPSMLVVAAGPGLLQVFKYLFPLMKTFH